MEHSYLQEKTLSLSLRFEEYLILRKFKINET